MKKILSFVVVAFMAITSVSAQSAWTFNTRSWCTNYWTMLIYEAARSTVVVLTEGDEDNGDAQTLERIIPDCDLVFPVGIEKAGFADPNDIRGPYYYAFGTPFKHVGDFAVGIDASWTPTAVGLYLGAFYKSQELVFKTNDDHLRAFYFQPRAGLVFGRQKASIEAGVYYDMPISAYGTPGSAYADAEKTMFAEGLGLDFALSFNIIDNNRTLIQFSMPLHNFLNENHPSNLLTGLHRRVGYIMLTQRISF